MSQSDGTVTKNYTYDAFGNEISPSETDANPWRYCGEYFDKETGNIYLRARYYAPAIGRFTQEDPVRDGLNWYTYCNNNPILFVDPWGLFTQEAYDMYHLYFAGMGTASNRLNDYMNDYDNMERFDPEWFSVEWAQMVAQGFPFGNQGEVARISYLQNNIAGYGTEFGKVYSNQGIDNAQWVYSEALKTSVAYMTYSPLKDYKRVTQSFGSTKHIHNKSHIGTDIGNSTISGSEDKPIKAIAAGTVISTVNNGNRGGSGGNGYTVVIEHQSENGVFYSVYAHLAAGSFLVKPGELVTAGQRIATMGNTGAGSNGMGVHLHLAICTKNTPPTSPSGYAYSVFQGSSYTKGSTTFYDPMKIFSEGQYW